MGQKGTKEEKKTTKKKESEQTKGTCNENYHIYTNILGGKEFSVDPDVVKKLQEATACKSQFFFPFPKFVYMKGICNVSKFVVL
jgi:hypothetical protein